MSALACPSFSVLLTTLLSCLDLSPRVKVLNGLHQLGLLQAMRRQLFQIPRQATQPSHPTKCFKPPPPPRGIQVQEPVSAGISVSD